MHAVFTRPFQCLLRTLAHAMHPCSCSALALDPQEQEQQEPVKSEREVRQEVTRRIKNLGEQRKFKEAVQELASLATLGVEPDTQAATALLAAATRSRDMKMAQSIFQQLFGTYSVW